MSEIATPSAFAAAEIHIEEFLNLEEFPIHDLTSPRRAELVAHCRSGLDKWGCSHLPDFILPSAIEAMHQEALRLIDKGYAREAHAWVNP